MKLKKITFLLFLILFSGCNRNTDKELAGNKESKIKFGDEGFSYLENPSHYTDQIKRIFNDKEYFYEFSINLENQKVFTFPRPQNVRIFTFPKNQISYFKNMASNLGFSENDKIEHCRTKYENNTVIATHEIKGNEIKSYDLNLCDKSSFYFENEQAIFSGGIGKYGQVHYFEKKQPNYLSIPSSTNFEEDKFRQKVLELAKELKFFPENTISNLQIKPGAKRFVCPEGEWPKYEQEVIEVKKCITAFTENETASVPKPLSQEFFIGYIHGLYWQNIDFLSVKIDFENKLSELSAYIPTNANSETEELTFQTAIGLENVENIESPILDLSEVLENFIQKRKIQLLQLDKKSKKITTDYYQSMNVANTKNLPIKKVGISYITERQIIANNNNQVLIIPAYEISGSITTPLTTEEEEALSNQEKREKCKVIIDENKKRMFQEITYGRVVDGKFISEPDPLIEDYNYNSCRVFEDGFLQSKREGFWEIIPTTNNFEFQL